jgi:hypothetical protein
MSEAQARAAESLAGHWPKKANRQKAANALAGGLLRANLPEDHVKRFIEAVAEKADDEEVNKRVGVVESTARKLRDGQPVTGWPTLAALLGPDGDGAVRRLLAELGVATQITLAELAEDKRLPVEFLQSLGLQDLPEGGVGIPYRDAAGRTVEVKKRTALKASEGSYWPKGKPPMAYGEDLVDTATSAGYLVPVEGESDVWTLAHHKFPALGLPGADTVHKTLAIGHVGSVTKVYVVQEPDAAGETFVVGVRDRLAAVNWPGQLLVVKLDGAKDPNDLHKQGPGQFRERFQNALDRAEPVDAAAASDIPLPGQRPWPDPPEPEAYHGLAGDLVRFIGPHSESHPAALLVQTLTAFGNVIGRGAHWRAEGDTHHLNLFIVLVGGTSKGRKGSSWGHIRRLFEEVEEKWARERAQGGLSSGEGLMWHVRDPIEKREPVKEKGRVVDYQTVTADPGIDDKRLLCYEPEFASVLKVLERQGNTLSTTIRQAWESGNMQSMTKNNPAKATGAHVSIVGHITADEVRRYLSATEQANGFGNRFIWLLVKRVNVLPEGGGLRSQDLAPFRERLKQARAFAEGVGEMGFDEAARAAWHRVYEELSEGKPGLAGGLLARAEAQVRRLACIYAVLDLSAVVRLEHLQAALALWEYAEASVRYIFGDSTGDPLADEILQALRARSGGLTRSEIRELVGHHAPARRVAEALGVLLGNRLAEFRKDATGGRSVERWFGTGKGGKLR